MTEARPDGPSARKIGTGSPGLDAVLAGGLFRGDTYLLVGPPGAGKTILSNQLCFAQAAAGRHTLFISLLAETPEQLLGQIRDLSFFRERAVGATVTYLSAYSVLETDGLDGLRTFLWQVIRDTQATLLVLDGLAVAQEAATSLLAYKRFLHHCNVYTRAAGCTTIFLSQIHAGASPPDYTLVDCVIELDMHWVGTRTVRELRVVKQRGGPFLEGPHAYAIGDDGLTVFPRTEALYAAPPERSIDDAVRRPFGIASLDAMLGSGLVAGTSTMLLGTPGAGKTLLGLTFLAEGARQGQPGLYFGFFETPPRLTSLGDEIGLSLSDRVATGLLELLWQPALENVLDRLANRLLTAVAARAVQRLFIDGFEGFQEASVDPERIGRFLAALTNELRARGVTSVISTELRTWLGPAVEAPVSGLAAVAENVLFLRHVELGARLYRLISILKQRGSGYDASIRQLTISASGIDVAASFGSAEAILTGVARVPSGSGTGAPTEPQVEQRDADPGRRR